MHSRDAAYLANALNKPLNSIAKSLVSINKNLASLVEQTQFPELPTQQVRGSPSTQLTIDGAIKQLEKLKWDINPSPECAQRLDRLIDQLLIECYPSIDSDGPPDAAAKIPCSDTSTWEDVNA